LSKEIKTINILYAITDTLVCILAVACFGAAAYLFNKWWIVLFNLVPLFLFFSHTLIIDSQIKEENEDGEETAGR
jgi:fatty acid desaturase